MQKRSAASGLSLDCGQDVVSLCFSLNRQPVADSYNDVGVVYVLTPRAPSDRYLC